MQTLNINLKERSYDIIIEDNLLDKIDYYINNVYQNKKIYIITDSNVSKYYLDKVMKVLEKSYIVKSVVIEAGEQSKCFDTYNEVCQKLLDLDIRRNELLLALGGGVVGDLTGFIAATLYRGLHFINVPTSLLSQMDSSIGGKTGIDFYNRKNIIGCFKQPLTVLIDPKTLDTLPKHEYISGMGELIKHAVIGSETLINKLLDSNLVIDEQVIKESLIVKKNVVEIDEFDQKERMYLNFGHTFGHIIEMKYNLSHGHAVGVGMLLEVMFGIDLNVTNKKCFDILNNILLKYGFTYDNLDYKDYLKDIIYDKKNLAGVINFVLIEDFSKPILYKISEDSIK